MLLYPTTWLWVTLPLAVRFQVYLILVRALPFAEYEFETCGAALASAALLRMNEKLPCAIQRPTRC